MNNGASSSKGDSSSPRNIPRIVAVKKIATKNKPKGNQIDLLAEKKLVLPVREYKIDSLGNFEIANDISNLPDVTHRQTVRDDDESSQATQAAKKTGNEILNSKGQRPPPVIPKPKKKSPLEDPMKVFVDENGDPLYAPVVKNKDRSESELSSPASESSSQLQAIDETTNYQLEPFYALPERSP